MRTLEQVINGLPPAERAKVLARIEQLQAEVEKQRAEVERRRAFDREAAEYVESVICMRTHFTGEPPYVGWKGLGLALNEALDERDRLRALEGGSLGS